MANKLRVATAATIFLGDADPSNSLHMEVKSFKLPALKVQTKAHTPGGSFAGININMGVIEPLEFTFKLEGVSTAAMAMFMSPRAQNYTVRANLYDTKDQTNEALVAVIRGVMTSTDLSEYSRENGVEGDYMISNVLAYRMHINGDEIHYFAPFEGPSGLRIMGQPVFDDVARNLGLA
jgi:P2 family phage contractile tail tube protein